MARNIRPPAFHMLQLRDPRRQELEDAYNRARYGLPAPPPKAQEPDLQTVLAEIAAVREQLVQDRKSARQHGAAVELQLTKRPKPGPTKQDIAIGLLLEHPDWTNREITERVGVHEKSLYRWSRFRELRDKLKKIARREFEERQTRSG